MIQKIEVTSELAFNYLKDQLSRGGFLSDLVNNIPIESGVIYSFVPSEASEESIFNFKSGGIYPVDLELLAGNRLSIPIPNEARPLVVQIIQQNLDNSDFHCCLFEDQIQAPDDPITIRNQLNFVHLDGEKIFYFFNQKTNDALEIEKALVTSEEYVFLCALSSVDKDIQNEFLRYQAIDLNLLREFAKGIFSFFVQAYDHEGFLMWYKYKV